MEPENGSGVLEDREEAATGGQSSIPLMTLDDAEQLDRVFGELLTYQSDILSLPDQLWIPKYLRRSGIAFAWSSAYELPLATLLALMLVVTQQDNFQGALKRREGYATLIAMAEEISDSSAKSKVKKRAVVLSVACLVALIHHVRAIGLHSLSMDELLCKGLRGDALALRRAVAVDPTVLALPGVNALMSRLLRLGRHREWKLLYRAAMNGPNKELQKNARLRYFERVLRDGRVVELEGREAVFRLITERLRLHTHGGSDPYKSLFTMFQRWRESATT